MNRREFARLGMWSSLLLPSPFASNLFAAPSFAKNPFALGVASGDPLPNGIVLWTRLMPSDDAAWSSENVEVSWQLAEDENFTKGLRQGKTVARPNLGHSVHVDVRGLQPHRWYWYRFDCGGASSPVGRTRTAPASAVDQIRFAFASCQHYETGLFTAYQHMAAEELDLVVHLGDYIYEGKGVADRVRKHTGDEIKSLNDYRNRYALYKSDPHLQEAHRLFPWVVTWDDHEVDNNYAGEIPEDKQTRVEFLERRASAYQAYYEFMPLRKEAMPKGTQMKLYRDLSYGPLAKFFVVDTRQYRSDQPCGDGDKPACPETTDPNQTMFGAKQEKWLTEGMKKSGAQWNIIANQVMLAKIDRDPTDAESFPMDQWSGYETARRRFMHYLETAKPSNPVALTGDVHSSWVCDLRTDYRNTKAPVAATEFVGTSITSGGDGVDVPPRVAAYLPGNPHVKFYNSKRGYVVCNVTAKQMTADYRTVARVSVPGEPIASKAKFVVEAGQPGAKKL